MNMKFHLKSILQILLFISITNQLKAQDNSSYYITKKGEKVFFNGTGNWGRCPNGLKECFYFNNEKGKSDYELWNKLERINMHSWYFISMPIDDKGKNKELMELVLQNGKYKLFRLYGINQYDELYIYDSSNKLVEKDVKLTKGRIQTGMALNSKTNNLEVKQLILKYFSDCDGLEAQMSENYKNQVNLLNQVGYRGCSGAADPELLFKK